MSDYWLLDWIDDEGIADLDVIRGVLNTKSGYKRMLSAADTARRHLPDPPRDGKSLVTGSGLDLSGVLGCNFAGCLMQTVDKLVRRSWCYFDRVVVTGLDPNEFLQLAVQGDKAFARGLIVNHAEAALHVRDIGAEEFITFRRKAQLCTDHWAQHAVEAGLPPVDPAIDALADELAQGYRLKLEQTGKVFSYSFSHPLLYTTTYGEVRKRPKKKDLAKALIRRQAARIVAGLTRSVWLCREVHGALGQSALEGGKVVTVQNSDHPSVADVAMNLRLPVLEGASVEQLLALRRDDASEFEVFRGALTKTIEERVKALPDERADRVGQSVVEDVLQPAMAALDLRMRKSARLLGERSVEAVAAGGMVTTIGLLASAPLTIPGLILASGVAATGGAEFLKQRRDLELSDLHFLWRADKSLHA
jgi:hypothetical protein